MKTAEIHEQLIALSSEPVPDAGFGWARLESALPARRQGLLTRVGSWVRRPFIISIASMTLGTGAAYAAGFEPVRNGVDWAWVQVIGGGDDAEDARGSHLDEDDSEPPATGGGKQDDRPSAVDADRDDGKLDKGSDGHGGPDRGDDGGADDDDDDRDGDNDGGDTGGEDSDDTRPEDDGDSEDDEGPEDDDSESDDGPGDDDADDPSNESDEDEDADDTDEIDSGGSDEDRDVEDGRELEAPDMSEIEDGDDFSEED